jgi:hypothetical protein
MAFRVNYNQQRADRTRAKEAKKRERLARRDEDAQKRKAERDGLLSGSDAPDAAPSDADDTTAAPDQPRENE